MKPAHALAISLLLAVAVVAGAFAAYTTAGLGSRNEPSTTEIAAREAELDRYQQELRSALAQQPPPLPSLAVRQTAPAAALVATAPGPTLAPSYDDEEVDDQDDDGSAYGDEREHGDDD
jgi:hypothetical protein